jgi:soluble lytic murein transglycosylase-like protein
MPPMSTARRRAVRAVLSALAGGGLTAAGLGGPLAAVVLAAEGTTSTTETTESRSAPVESESHSVEPGGGLTGTTTTPTATGTETTPPPSTTPSPSTSTTPATTTQTTTSSRPPLAPPKNESGPTVVLKRPQKPTSSPNAKHTTTTKSKSKSAKPTGPNEVALSPQAIAAEAAALANTAASVQALGFYRIPLFLLPIYKAAAVQYGVPWQILAAINEIETNYGTDLSVSSAGAIGWMQFMPATWLQYGVDALNAGYADPYNPVDAIFAAARYLRAAGAATNLQAAILAYNHSEEYVSSVLLRAKLISAYPKAIIATLTGLVDGRPPVTGPHVAWVKLPTEPQSSSSATAEATLASAGHGPAPAGHATSPQAVAAAAASAGRPQLVELTSVANAQAVAVDSGRIVKLGASSKLGKYVVLRDVYGDVFTYAALGSLAQTYSLPRPAGGAVTSPVIEAASKQDPAPSRAASAGVQPPLTLHVTAPAHKKAASVASIALVGDETAGGGSKVRLFARPGNPDARAAAVAARTARAQQRRTATKAALKVGAVVPAGTVLGTVTVAHGSSAGHMRFAIRPAGDAGYIDPGPVLVNWAQLQAALHPRGAKAGDALLGATSSDVFLLSKSELERSVLSDPSISIYGCGRHDIASGAIDKRVLAVLAFLARSGIGTTVTALRCGQSAVTATGAPSAFYRGDVVEISAINGLAVSGHQGAGTVTDLAIRTLLTLPAELAPSSIVSLMRYPGSQVTKASAAYADRIRIEFSPAVASVPAATHASAAHRARAAAVPVINVGSLTSRQWESLDGRIGGLPLPTVATKPSSSAIPDPRHP